MTVKARPDAKVTVIYWLVIESELSHKDFMSTLTLSDQAQHFDGC
jgi:hypothetical protein